MHSLLKFSFIPFSNPISRRTFMYNTWCSTHVIPEALRSSPIYIFKMSWHCAPLKNEGAISLPGNPWEGNPNLSPIRKGAVPVSNQKTAGHSLQSVDQWSQSPICRPVQITVDWPINRLSSRDGTYVSVSCNVHKFNPISNYLFYHHTSQTTI